MRPNSRTLYVWTGAACTYGCGDCPIDATAAPPGIEVAELQRQLEGRPACQLVVLVGGEPLLRPDLPRLLAVIRATGLLPGVTTTGRPLVYRQLRQRLRRVGLAYMRVQFFGRGDDHDRHAAVAGAYEQAIAGTRAWLAEGDAECAVDVALYARGRSAADLSTEVEELAGRIDSPRAQFLFAGGHPLDAEERQRVAAAIAEWNRRGDRPLLTWEGAAESAEPASCPTIPARRPAFLAISPTACCLGDVSAAGAAPPLEVVSNSFNFVRGTGPDTTLPYAAAPEACAADRVAPVGAGGRRLWLCEGVGEASDEASRLVQYETDTGDFSDAEVARIVDQWSHLFVDRAAAGVLDDFKEGMRRVLPDEACFRCARRERCARRFRVVEGQPFAREEAWIADYVRRLRGRVLDVGCGEQLYRDEIVPLVRSGRVVYTGLDPDEPTLARWRDLLPDSRFFATGIEDFAGEPSGYRHVLCLRSLNHVLDLDEAMARMAGMVEPGGQVLIVETTPFAMLRTADQVAAADRAPRAGHQHYRNLTSHDVLPYARRHSLRVVHHHSVGLATTNEWILLLERSPSLERR